MTFEPPAPAPEPSAGSMPAESPPPAPSQPADPAASQDDWSASPPPAAPAAPASPASPAAPASSSADAFNPAAVNPLDWGILAAGFLALLFSFVSYYTATAKSSRLRGSVSESVTAWHGFFGWFAALVALASAVLLAIHIFLPSAKFRFPLRAFVLAGFAVATVCVIIAAFVTPGKASPGLLRALDISVDYGRGAGFWLSLIVILAGAVMSFLRLRESGGSLPWVRSRT